MVLCSVLPLRPPSATASEGCITLTALDSPAWKAAAQAQPRGQPPVAPEHLAKPMTEADMLEVMRGLELVEKEKGKGAAPRALVEGTWLGLPRFGVLVGDVTSVLLDIHAAETVDRLRKAPGVNRETLAWAEKYAAGVHGCVEASFAPRGGDPAFRRVQDFVRRHRGALETSLGDFWRLQAQRPRFGPGRNR